MVPKLDQHLPSGLFRLGGQPAALVVSETQTFPAQLFSQDPILFPKVVDEEELAAVHQAGQCDQNEPERVQEEGHSGSNISLSQKGTELISDKNLLRIHPRG
jgi:hypothetical protein